MLVRLDQPEQLVRATIGSMLEGGGGSDLCWEVATAYGAKARAAAAAEWAIRGLDLATDAGRDPIEYLRYAVVSLGEAGEWERALDLVDEFAARSPSARRDAEPVRAFVSWRTGAHPAELPAADSVDHRLSSYWLLECDWADGVDDPRKFLERVRGALPVADAPVWMRSLEADILASSGRAGEALPIARMAMDDLAKRPTDAFARVNCEIVEQRLRRIERLAGR